MLPVSGGEARKVIDACVTYAWSPDSRKIAVISGGVVSTITVDSYEFQQILDLNALDIDDAWWLHWSPDGKYLTFFSVGKEGGKQCRILMVPASGGEVVELAPDDQGDSYVLYWSPDSKWVSYNSDQLVKMRPEGTIWELEVKKFLDGLFQR